MVYCTGDTHGSFRRFNRRCFPERTEMTKDDFVIICGDFGGVWYDTERPSERKNLDWLESMPFTLLFVDGNHENFEALAQYPVEDWHGGRVHCVRPHVLHLMRGQIFDIDGHSFFAMGGARSHDISDGILEPDDPDFKRKYRALDSAGAMFRVNHVSWWKEELPSPEEYAEARRNLERVGYKADYIITHCAPSGIEDMLGRGAEHDELTDFFEELRKKVRFRYWLHGHYHDNRNLTLDGANYVLLYEQIVRVI